MKTRDTKKGATITGNCAYGASVPGPLMNIDFLIFVVTGTVVVGVCLLMMMGIGKVVSRRDFT